MTCIPANLADSTTGTRCRFGVRSINSRCNDGIAQNDRLRALAAWCGQ
jgi:hypothetical protein